VNDRPILVVIEGDGEGRRPPQAFVRRHADGVVIEFISDPATVDQMGFVIEARKTRWIRDADEAR
jgi:hypothetical protein